MNRKFGFAAFCMVAMSIFLIGCGPSEAEVAAQVATSAAATVAVVPTVTPYPTYTSQPTVTPYPTYTPLPTATPYPTYTPYPSSTPKPPTATPTPEPPTPTPLPATATSIPPTATPASTIGQIEGKLFRSDTNEPIANVLVTLEDSTLEAEDPKRTVGETTTNDQGYYSFGNLQPGEYNLRVTMKVANWSSAPCNPPIPLFFYSQGQDQMIAIEGESTGGTQMLIVTGASATMAAGEGINKDIDLVCQ